MKRNINFKFHVIQMSDQKVTVGYVPTVTQDGLNVKIAAAWTNPKDQFVKARGREIVAGRLDANRNLLSITVPNTKHPERAAEYRELESKIVDHVMDNMPKAVSDSIDRKEKRIRRLIASM